MNMNYLIPANSKRSMLILGMFKMIDLIIFLVGLFLTAVLVFIIEEETMTDLLVIVSPLLISIIMIMPIPNHRNVWQLTVNIWHYFTNQRKYRWKGWCFAHGEDEGEK